MLSPRQGDLTDGRFACFLQGRSNDGKGFSLAGILRRNEVRLFDILRIQLTEVDELSNLDGCFEGTLRFASSLGSMRMYSPLRCSYPFTISLCATGRVGASAAGDSP